MRGLNIHVVPSFHYDLAYLRTFREYMPRVKYILVEMLNLAKEHPSYTFLLEQAFLLKLAARLIPEHLSHLRELVSTGRVEVAAPYIQTDNNMVLGESFLRNVVWGRRLIEAFGGRARILWLGDVFGNNAQIPQIASACGFKYVQFSRGLGEDPPKVFLWKGLGGALVVAYYGSYGGSVPESLEGFKALVDQLSRGTGGDVLLLSGGDYAVPDRELPQTVEKLNSRLGDIRVFFSAPSRFLESFREKALPVVEGDMNPTLTGTYGSRIRVKQGCRRVEYRLLSAEAVATAAFLLGYRYPYEELASCWEDLFKIQFHDVLAGSCVDPVYEWALRIIESIDERLDSLVSEALGFIASKAESDAPGLPVIVFNPLPYPRRDVVRIRLSFTDRDVDGVRIFDGEMEVPCQLVDKEFYGEEPPSHLPAAAGPGPGWEEESLYASRRVSMEKGGLKSAMLLFIAEVPPFGYKIYRVVKGVGGQALRTDVKAEGLSLENRFFKVVVGRDGTVKSLVHKETGDEFVSSEKPFFNSLVLQIDRGDFYNVMPLPDPRDPYPRSLADIYREYRSGKSLPPGEAALAERYFRIGDPKLWGFAESWHGVKSVELVESGPVRVAVKVSGEIAFWTTIRLRYVQYIFLYAGIPRIEFETVVEHHGKHYRLRACFPTSIGRGVIRHEVPFGYVERGEGEYPALNWVDYSADGRGLCLLNRGLPGNNVVDGIMFITLMRSTAFEYKGESSRGFMEGETVKYEYAAVPHVKPDLHPHLLGAEYNAPLLARPVEKPCDEAGMPREMSFLSIEPVNVMASAIYVEDGSLIIRIYEAEGRKAMTRIKFFKKPKHVEEVKADGVPVKPLSLEGSDVVFEIGPFEIKTLKITF